MRPLTTPTGKINALHFKCYLRGILFRNSLLLRKKTPDLSVLGKKNSFIETLEFYNTV